MYILKEGVPVPAASAAEWGQWFENNENRVIKRTEIGEVAVSTVFLGIDHSSGGGMPILFETMIFGGEHDGYQERYSTIDGAKHGHGEAVGLVRAAVLKRLEERGKVR